jgi:hypothetical protein
MKEEMTNEPMDRLLQGVYEGTQPADSWEGLRDRIEQRLDDRRHRQSLILWRRAALALAACLVVTLGLLGYVWMRAPAAAAAPLLTSEQLVRLSTIFAQIRGMFAEQAAWFMVDSAGQTQMGLSNGAGAPNEAAPVVVLRLVLEEEGGAPKPQYWDVVALVRHPVDLRVSLQDGRTIAVSLLPELTAEGVVTLQTHAPTEGWADSGEARKIPDARYTSLGRVRAGSRWIGLQAIAKVVSI